MGVAARGLVALIVSQTGTGSSQLQTFRVQSTGEGMLSNNDGVPTPIAYWARVTSGAN